MTIEEWDNIDDTSRWQAIYWKSKTYTMESTTDSGGGVQGLQ